MPTNCSKCGAEIKVVPAGISKKTGNPYGAFYKCKSCGNGQSVSPQSSTNEPKSNKVNEMLFERLRVMEAKEDRIIKGLQILVEALVPNIGKPAEEPPPIDLPF